MKRYLPLAVCVLLAIAGFGSGTLINQVGVRYALSIPEGEAAVNLTKAAPPPVSTGKKRAGGGKRVQSDAQYLSQILGRNIFDPDAIGVKAIVTSDGDISDLKVILQATMVAVPSYLSVAFIAEDKPDGYPLGYGIGETVLNAQIVAIEVGRVQIRKPDGKLEYLVLHREATPNRPGRKATRGTGDSNITKEDETHFTVARELLDKHLGNIAGISKLGRARPHKGTDGKVDGYRLSGIRRGTVGEKLGIKNGDIIHGVNGFNLNSMSEAMNAFQDLQSQAQFKFEVTRRGQKMTLNYDVR